MTAPYAHGAPAGDDHTWIRLQSADCPGCSCTTRLCGRGRRHPFGCWALTTADAQDLVRDCPCSAQETEGRLADHAAQIHAAHRDDLQVPDLAPPLRSYLTEVVRALERTGRLAPEAWDANPDIPLIHIALEHRRELTWTPTVGWSVHGVYPATGTPAGKARYLAAGPLPAPTRVAELVHRWADTATTLTAMQPFYRMERTELPDALRTAAHHGGNRCTTRNGSS